MSSKFNHFAPKKTPQHSLKSTQYTFKHCTKIFECFKDGKMHARLSNLFNKMVRQMTILTEFDNLHTALNKKDILPKKLSSSFCHALAYLS